MLLLCYSLMRHKNPLEIFPDGHPPPGKLGKLTPPPPLWKIWYPPWRWYGYFLEPHNQLFIPFHILWLTIWSQRLEFNFILKLFSLFYLYYWMKNSQKICHENTFRRKKSNFASPIFLQATVKIVNESYQKPIPLDFESLKFHNL